MNSIRWLLILVFVSGLASVWAAPAKKARQFPDDLRLRRFIEAKAAQVNDLIEEYDLRRPPEVKKFFDAARAGDWDTIFRVQGILASQTTRFAGSLSPKRGLVDGSIFQTVYEVYVACDAFYDTKEEYLKAFALPTIRSIPPGSILFSGSDSVRGLISSMQASQINGIPFFTIAHGTLVDSSYQRVLRHTYVGKITLPSSYEARMVINNYIDGARRRYIHDRDYPDEPKQLEDGENVVLDPRTGRASVSGGTAVTKVNALLAQKIFDRNPRREFFVQARHPIKWMYRHLEPHGFIMKLNRAPLTGITPEMVERDRQHWQELCSRFATGGKPKASNPAGGILGFATSTAIGVDPVANTETFFGDEKYPYYARRLYASLRSEIAGLYFWWSENHRDESERKRMRHEAGLAYNQALAIFAADEDAATWKHDQLVAEGKKAEAILFLQRALELDGDSDELRGLLEKLLGKAPTN